MQWRPVSGPPSGAARWRGARIGREVDVAASTVETQLGLPAPEAIDKLYDLRDRHAATMLYLWGLPIVAMAQLQRAHRGGARWRGL
jgi:hypothetical protein